MPGNHGLAGLAAIRAQHPGVAVMVVSANDDPRVIRRALDHGAAGYLPKSTGLNELRDAIRTVMACEQWPPPDMRGAVASTRTSTEDSRLAARLATACPRNSYACWCWSPKACSTSRSLTASTSRNAR